MSRKTTVKVTCPKCKKEFEAVCWDSLNADLNPAEKLKLLDGTFFDQKCEHCGTVATMFYPTLYHDMSKKVMIWFFTDENATAEAYDTIEFAEKELDAFEEGGKYKYRIVFDPNDLREKVLIVDNGLDDRVIEVLKLIFALMTMEQYPDERVEIVYFDVDDKGEYIFKLYCESENVITANLDKVFYTAIANEYADVIEKASVKKYVIDQNWAVRIWKK